jgi:glutamate 5-kinase
VSGISETLPKTTPCLPTVRSFRRIVIKVGSSLLIDQGRGCVRKEWLELLAEDIAALHMRGADVLVVSSGAVALGRTVLGLAAKGLKLEDSQAAAAVGQIALARIWAEVLADKKITAGQILVTFGDTEERQRYLNARATIARLLDLRAVPVINENDTVATNELRYGDNDRLAARVATMASADLLIVLSDVPGLYTAPPAENPGAELVPLVTHVDEKIEAMAGSAASQFSRGGMRTKIEAAKIATTGGTHMLIADGRIAHPVARLNEPVPCTWFLSGSNPVTARKKWIAGSLEPRGALYVDAGAAHAIINGKSLLPAGITRVEGNFLSGDCVLIRDARSAEIGRGLVGYDSAEAALIAGRNSRAVLNILGAPGRAAIIHRDDMVLGSGYIGAMARGENGKPSI